MSRSTLLRHRWSLQLCLFLVIVLFAVESHAVETSTPKRAVAVANPLRATKQGRKLSVNLAPSLRQAIRQHFPGFFIPSSDAEADQIYQDPKQRSLSMAFACVGDFDGNVLPDAALYLMNRRRRWLFVAFHQTVQGTFLPHLILARSLIDLGKNEHEERLNTLDDYGIERKSKGSRLLFSTSRFGVSRMTLKNDAISEYYDESEQVFYFRKGRYRYVDITSDE